MTIRRDLDALAAAGLVEKVHGGATRARRLSAPTSRGSRRSRTGSSTEKEAIARVAAAARRAGPGGRPDGRHDDVAARAPPRRHPRPDRRHELDPGRERPAPRAPAGPHRHPHGRRAHTLRRARRPGRRDDPPLAARRRALHGRARHDRGRRLHHAEPARGRDRPGASSRRPSASSSSPTTRSGEYAVSVASRGSTRCTRSCPTSDWGPTRATVLGEHIGQLVLVGGEGKRRGRAAAR